MKLSVPKQIGDIDENWALSLVSLISNLESLENVRVLHYDLQVQPNTDGVLSDICKVHLNVKVGPDEVIQKHRWFVKVVPQKLKILVTHHGLFEKEIAFYSQVLPALESFMRSQKYHHWRHFKAPKYIYGDVVSHGEGVLVLEDLSPDGYDTFDSANALMDKESLTACIMALAEFHGLCIAHDMISNTPLKQMYPLFESSRLMWAQKDMQVFLKKVSESAAKFLKALNPGDPLWLKFARSMRDPKVIMEREFSRPLQKSSQSWQCLQHGDSWHNNFLLLLDHHRRNHGSPHHEVHVIDWQVAYFGHGPTDLCYLILSSSTKLTRLRHLEHFLHAYYRTLTQTLEAMQLAFTATFEDLKAEYVASIPYCLLFCANAEDFVLDPAEATDDGLILVASDKQMDVFEAAGPRGGAQFISADKKLARGIRRRNFLDLCREADAHNLL